MMKEADNPEANPTLASVGINGGDFGRFPRGRSIRGLDVPPPKRLASQK